jgi:hypothetical protein
MSERTLGRIATSFGDAILEPRFIGATVLPRHGRDADDESVRPTTRALIWLKGQRKDDVTQKYVRKFWSR